MVNGIINFFLFLFQLINIRDYTLICNDLFLLLLILILFLFHLGPLLLPMRLSDDLINLLLDRGHFLVHRALLCLLPLTHLQKLVLRLLFLLTYGLHLLFVFLQLLAVYLASVFEKNLLRDSHQRFLHL